MRSGIEIRVARPEDAEKIQAIYAPIVLNTAISFEEAVPSVEEMLERIATTLQTYPYLVAMQEGRVVGYAYASQHRARGVSLGGGCDGVCRRGSAPRWGWSAAL